MSERTEAQIDEDREREFDECEQDRDGWFYYHVEDAVNFARMFRAQRDDVQERLRHVVVAVREEARHWPAGGPSQAAYERLVHRVQCIAKGETPAQVRLPKDACAECGATDGGHYGRCSRVF